jgi:hypothetical protein
MIENAEEEQKLRRWPHLRALTYYPTGVINTIKDAKSAAFVREGSLGAPAGAT